MPGRVVVLRARGVLPLVVLAAWSGCGDDADGGDAGPGDASARPGSGQVDARVPEPPLPPGPSTGGVTGGEFPSCPSGASAIAGLVALTIDEGQSSLHEVALLMPAPAELGPVEVEAGRVFVAAISPTGFWEVAPGDTPTWHATKGAHPIRSFHSADLDDDGDIDLVTRHDVSAEGGSPTPAFVFWERTSGGLVRRADLVAPNPEDLSPAVADTNGDGNVDLVMVQGDVPVVYQGDGAFGFERTEAGPPVEPRGREAARVDVYDANGDGNDDVVGFYRTCCDYRETHIGVHPGDGAGRFGAAIVSALGDDAREPSAFGDVTGDGYRDVAFTHFDRLTDGTAVYVARGRPDGTFSLETREYLVPDGGPLVPLLADLDGDGVGEIVVQGEEATILDARSGGDEFAATTVGVGAHLGLGLAANEPKAGELTQLFSALRFECPQACTDGATRADAAGDDDAGGINGEACLFGVGLACVDDGDCGRGRCSRAECVECLDRADCGEEEQCSRGTCVRAVGEAVGWTAIDVGGSSYAGGGCAIGTDGGLRCWGADWGSVPTGTFTAAAVGPATPADAGQGCVLAKNGDLDCWSAGMMDASWPSGPFVAVSSNGWRLYCGIREDRSAVCWTLDGANAPQPPEGRYAQISAGDDFGCGILESDEIRCWGCDDPPNSEPARSGDGGVTGCWINYGQGLPPTGKFSALAAGQMHACAIELGTGKLRCWGDNFAKSDAHTGSTVLPGGPYVAVSAGHRTSCALDAQGRVRCFGPWDWQPHGAAFTAISMHGADACGIRNDGRLECRESAPP